MLENVKLKTADFAELDTEKFDYIIVHGVLSWIPKQVQSKLLAVVSKHLQTNGIAYISYNTYPGWHRRQVVRDFMLNASRGLKDQASKLKVARADLEILADTFKDNDSAHAKIVREELETIQNLPDWFVAHDLMSPEQHPFHFEDFCLLLEMAGLHFLSEVNLEPMLPEHFNPDTEKLLRKESDLVKREQLADYFCNRAFRESLISHGKVSNELTLSYRAVIQMYVRASVEPIEGQLDGPTKNYKSKIHKNVQGKAFSITSPKYNRVLEYLSTSWPRAVPFEELLQAALDPEEEVQAKKIKDLTSFLVSLFFRNFIELHLIDPGILDVTNQPMVTTLARAQIALGAPITNGALEPVSVTEATCVKLLPLLDGTRDKNQLASIIDVEMTALNTALNKLADMSLLVKSQ